MDVFIKSFNRIFYLDRCIASLLKSVTGVSRVIVLDDGTPDRYLTRLKAKFPAVEILRSPAAADKAAEIEARAYQPRKHASGKILLPVSFWHDAVAKGSEYSLLLEDDFWFLEPLDLAALEKTARANDLALVKLFWIGHAEQINTLHDRLDQHGGLVIYRPRLDALDRFFLSHQFFYQLMFGLNNRNMLGKRVQWHYQAFLCAGAVYRRDYWSRTWQAAPEVANERFPLRKAVATALAMTGERFARTRREVVGQSFLTSALGVENLGADISLMKFNTALNDAWLDGQLDGSRDLPRDFSPDAIAAALESRGLSGETWRRWSSALYAGYQQNGHVFGGMATP